MQFDPATVAAMREAAAQNASVYLTLQIANNNNNWSQDEDNFVDVHALPENLWIAGGNGKTSGLPANQVVRGNGAGVTWNLPYDANTADNKKQPSKKKSSLPWDGGDRVMLNATAPGVPHSNGLSGQVSWDVTQDVLSGAHAWIVKVRDEYEPMQSPERREAGFDPYRGAVDYYSKEGADLAVGCVFPPMLQLVGFNNCGGSSESGESSRSLSALSIGVSV